MPSERYRAGGGEFSANKEKGIEEAPPLPENEIARPAPETSIEQLPNKEKPEKTSKASFLDSISTVSEKDLSKYAKLLAKKVDIIPKEDCALLLVQMMQRFMVEETNETAVERKAGGRTRLAAEFEEFQSSSDMEKQTQRYMVEMLIEEWVRSTGRHLVDPESSRQVNEAVRTIREDMKVGWFKRIFRGKLSETEIIKSMEALQFELDEAREKLKKAKLKEAETVRNSATVIDKTQKEAQEIKTNAEDKAEQLIGEAKKEARGIIKEAREESKEMEANTNKKVQTAEERVKSANLEEERLRAIIAELKSNSDVAQMYETKYGKEESLRQLKRDVLFLKGEIRRKDTYYKSKLQNILDSFAMLTAEEKTGVFSDIWIENGGSMTKIPSESSFWRAMDSFRPVKQTANEKKSMTVFEHGVNQEQAETIMGKENFFGMEAVEKAFGIQLDYEDIPEIPFSVAELERAKELNQFLVLRTDKAPDGQPLTMLKMNEIQRNKKGNVLYNATEKWKIESEFFTVETPKVSWALSSRDILPYSNGKNYLQQTEELVKYLTDEVFKDQTLPSQYEAAIKEWADYYDKNFQDQTSAQIAQLLSGGQWIKYAKELSELQLNELTRHSPVEELYDELIHFQNTGKIILEKKYSLSKCRSSSGYLVGVGYFIGFGVDVSMWLPGRSDNSLGVSFSRSQ